MNHFLIMVNLHISNLRSRVQLVEGNLQYDSVENEGTTAIIRVPV